MDPICLKISYNILMVSTLLMNFECIVIVRFMADAGWVSVL